MKKELHTKYSQSEKLSALIRSIDNKRAAFQGKSFIIGIDGHCGSGKSSVAEWLKERYSASLFHIDDFYLPLSMRSKERFSRPGGNIHSERLLEEVILKVENGEAVHYRKFNPQTATIEEGRDVPYTSVVIIEGSYSMQKALDSHYDYRVFMEVDAEEQQRRLEKRETPEKLAEFQDRWIPMEHRYFKQLDLQAVDFILDTTHV